MKRLKANILFKANVLKLGEVIANPLVRTDGTTCLHQGAAEVTFDKVAGV